MVWRIIHLKTFKKQNFSSGGGAGERGKKGGGTFREEFSELCYVHYSASSPHSPESYLLTDQISQTIFVKGHPRNIFVKLFQNWTSGFRRDVLRISSCLRSASSLHSPHICLLTDNILSTIFRKDHTRKVSVK